MTENCSNMASETVRSTKREDIRKTGIKYVVHCFGFALAFGSYTAVVFLQSSMNIEGSLGSMSVALTYIASFIFSLFFVPSLVRRFGCRLCWLFADLTYLMYILANFHPAVYTLIPAGILIGIGESLFWASAPMVFVYFANVHAKYGSRPIKSYIRRYASTFYVTMQSSMIGGNLISWFILFYSAGDQDVDGLQTSLNNNTSNASDESAERFLYCGANDCADSEITNENLDQYVPNVYSTYALLSVFTSLCIIAILVHYRTVPDLKTCGTEMNIMDNGNTDGIPMADDTEKKTGPSVKETMKANFKHCVKIQQLLITPILFYYGLYLAYFASDITRAFVSCLMGVEQIGIAVVVYSFASVLTSAAYSQLTGRFGRNTLVPVVMLFDLANYFFQLLWKPQSDTLKILYINLALFGMSDGFWKNFITDFTTDYFRTDHEIAFNVWNIWITLGLAVQFALGSFVSLCVRTKIYMMIAAYITSVISYAVAERRYLRRNIKNPN